MQKYILLLLLFICIGQNALAQWEQKAETPSASFLAVDIHESGVCYAAGYPMVKSVDEGETWSEVVFPGPDSLYFHSLVFNDIKVISATTTIAVGWHFFNDNNVIIRTDDGGVSWDVVFEGTFGTGIEFQAISFYDALLGVAVGDNGTVYKTTDGGVSWSFIPSGITEDLTDVTFTIGTSVIAVGKQKILRSLDAGSTWLLQWQDDKYFESVKYNPTNNKTTSIYRSGTSFQSYLFISDNYGATWSSEAIEFGNVKCHEVTAGDSIYFGFEGGLLLGLTDSVYLYNFTDYDFEQISDIEFKEGYGLAVTKLFDESKIYKFNIENPWSLEQIISFSVPDTICAGETYDLIPSNPTLESYTWLLDDVIVSTDVNFSFMTIDPGVYSIKLITEFEGNTNVEEKILNIIGPPTLIGFSYVGDELICVGSSHEFNLIDIADATGFSVKQDGIGIPFNTATGNDRSFLIESISATTIFQVDKWEINQCDSISITEFYSVEVEAYPDTSILFYGADELVCLGDSSQIIIPYPEINTTYLIFENGDSLSAAESMDGTELIFFTSAIDSENGYTIEAFSANDCYSSWSLIDSIKVEEVNAQFDIGIGYYLVDSVISIDTSNLIGFSYEWNVTGVPLIYEDLNEVHPNLVFADNGMYNLNLIVESESIGCIDSLTDTIYVNKIMPDSLIAEPCNVIDNSWVEVLDQTVDRFGNLIVVGYKIVPGVWWGFIMGGVIQKFNSEGELLWEFVQERHVPSYDNHKASMFNAVDTDEFGNIYFTGSCTLTHFVYNDSLIWSNPTSMPAPGKETFIMKVSPSGDFQWFSNIRVPSSSGGFSDVIVSDEMDRIYVGAINVGYKHYNSTLHGDYHIPASGSTGGVYLLELSLTGEMLHVFDARTTLHTVSSNRHVSSSRSVFTAPQLHLNADSTIYMVGEMSPSNSIIFDIGTIFPPTEGLKGFMLKINPNGEIPGWELLGDNLTSLGYGNNRVSSTIDDEGNLYIANWAQSMKFDGEFIDKEGSLILKYDQNFNLLWKKRFENIVIKDIYCESNQKVYFNGYSSDYGVVHGDLGPEYYISFDADKDENMILGALSREGGLEWLEAIGDKHSEKGSKLAGNGCGEVYLSGRSNVFYTLNSGITNVNVELNDYVYPDSLNGSFILKIADTCIVGGCGTLCDDSSLYPSPPIYLFDSVLYTSIDGYQSFQWYKNGVAISGATTANYSITELGTYTLEVIDLNGCIGMSAPREVTCTDGFDPPIPLILNVEGVLSTDIYENHQWYKNENLIAGAVEESYTLDGPGVYQVEIINNFGCTSESIPYELTCYDGYLPDFPILYEADGILSTDLFDYYQWYKDGDTIIDAINQDYLIEGPGVYHLVVNNEYDCVRMSFSYEVFCSDGFQVDTVILYESEGVLSTDVFDSYQWYRDGELIIGAVNQNYTTDSPGIYHLEIKNEFDCLSSSETFRVRCSDGYEPETPLVYEMDGVLSTAVYETYQWFKNGDILSGETSQFFTPLEVGGYQVTIENEYECSAFSELFEYSNLSLIALSKEKGFMIYPNPANGSVNLSFELMHDAPITFELLDITGKVIIRKKEVELAQHVQNYTIDLSDVASGVYFCKVLIAGSEYRGVLEILK